MKIQHYFFIIIAMMFPMIVLAADDVLLQDYLAQTLDAIKAFGGLPWMGKVASICFIIVGSMKVSFLRGLIWDRLGSAKAWVSVGLGLVGGILSLDHVTVPAVLAYMGAGAGAIIIHQLLDLVKAMPGIGPFWIMVIDMIAKVTGGKTVEEVKSEKIDSLQK